MATWRSIPPLSLFFSLVAASSLGAAPQPEHAGRHPNHLIGSTSPYLLQHAYNPVNWYPWGDKAFERARKEDKPIFLSIGYAACHWCHVMERESFENEKIARVLNDNFISIKVDREQRPDIDEIYMAATVAATGRGGWPMSIFMTPDRKPFLCGTYFPPESRRGRRGLYGLCVEIARKWKADRPALLKDAGRLVQQVQRRKRSVTGGREIISRATVSRVVDRIAGRFDPVLGGWRSGGSKFPPTIELELMMREYATQPEVSKPRLIDLVETTLTHMADGGIYDQIGGGICRYSTDPRWFAPHFEKMLYDQATVSGVYLSAFQLTGHERFARVARGILDFCLADLQAPDGGFYSSRDADSEGEEGKFYVWRWDELNRLLSPDAAALFDDYYHVIKTGNWHRGLNILYVSDTDKAFATRHGLSLEAWRAKLAAMRKIVLTARSKRISPRLDDKILVEWNGLLITSLARGYRILHEPRYRKAASRAADFILTGMVKEGRLFRAHRGGTTSIPAYATDYTNLVEGLITLYEVTSNRRWLREAEKLNDTFIRFFHDSTHGAFYYTASDAEKLLVRSKNIRDGVVPSAGSVAALNFQRLAILLDRSDLRDLADRTLQAMQPILQSGGLGRMQWALVFHHAHPKEIAIVGDETDPATIALVEEVYHNYLPNKVVTVGSPKEAQSPDALPLLKRKTLRNGKPAAYVCRNYLCGRPVTTPDELRTQLLKR